MPEEPGPQPQSSEELFARARGVLAGGVSHDNRFFAPYPTYFARAEGARIWDVEGNEYVDYSMGNASQLLGHSHPDIVRAIRGQAAVTTFHGNCHPLEVEWGELIQSLIPSAERVRFVASGTEATLLAVRLARAYTGKPKILRIEGHYHGWHDYLLLGLKAPWNEPQSLGILRAAVDATVVCPPDAERIRDALRGDDAIAGIILEPSGANWGSVPLPAGFLSDVRALADEFAVVLIFDEIITGFRWSPGGAQALYRVIPDLTTMAKIMAGGLPGGAVGGREEIMRLFDPAVDSHGLQPAIVHRGTFNGNPLAAAAGIAQLRLASTGEPQRTADGVARKLREGLQRILVQHQVAGAAYGESSAIHIYFGRCPDPGSVAGLTAAQIRQMPKETVTAFQCGLRRRGADLLSYMGGVTSAAHADAEVEKTLEAFEGTVRDLIQGGLVGRAG